MKELYTKPQTELENYKTVDVISTSIETIGNDED